MKSSDYVNFNLTVLLKKYLYCFSKIIYLLLGALFSSVIVVLLILIGLFYFLDEVEIKDTEFHISDIINYYFENDVSFSSIKFSKTDKQFLQVVLKNFSSVDVNSKFAIDIKKIDMSFDLYSLYSAKPVLSKLDLDEPEIFYTLNNTNQNYLNDNIFSNYIMSTEMLNIYNGNIIVSNITKQFSYNFDKVNLVTASRDNKRVILGKLVIKESIYSDQNPIFKFEIIDNDGVLFSKINFESFNPSSNFFNLLKIEEVDSVDALLSGEMNFIIKDRQIKNIDFSLSAEKGLILLSKSPVNSQFINTYTKYSFSNLISAGSYNFEEKSLIIDHLTFNLNNYNKDLNHLVFSGSLKRMNNGFKNIKVEFINTKLTNFLKLHYQELDFLNEIPISGELNILLNTFNNIIDFNLNIISHNNFVTLPEEFIFDKDFTYIKDIDVSISSEKNSKNINIETFGVSLVNSKSETLDIIYKGIILDKENDFIFNGMVNISNISLLSIISEMQNYMNKDSIIWLKDNIRGGQILNSDININISYNDIIKNKFIKDDFQLSMDVNDLEFILYDRTNVIKFNNMSIKYKDSKISLFSSSNDINGVQVEDINLNYFLENENIDLSFLVSGDAKEVIELFSQNFRSYDFNNFFLENGAAKIKFFLKFPVNKEFNLESIDKKITGSFSDFSVYNENFYSFIKTDKLEDIFLNFKIEDNYMKINGNALAGNFPINFEVFKNFNDFFKMQLDFILNEQNRKDLQIDFINLKGNSKVSLAVEENDSNWLISSNIDLYDNELLIPELNFIKNKKEICEVKLETILDKSLNFNNLTFEFKNELLNFSGNTFFNLESNNFNIKIDRFNYGENDFQSEILIEPNNTISVKIYGKRMFFPLFDLNSDKKIWIYF